MSHAESDAELVHDTLQPQARNISCPKNPTEINKKNNQPLTSYADEIFHNVGKGIVFSITKVGS